MSEDYRYKIICDPVHREIPVSCLEQRLIDSRSFQRLRNLKQLGLGSLVYPNATHSRFAHSLGVFRLMSRVIDLFVEKGYFSNDQRRKLRIAALLHDVGHYPYSHLMEYVDQDQLRPTLLRKGLSQSPSGSAGRLGDPTSSRYPSHEKIGELIIKRRTDISSILDDEGIDPAEIAAMIKGEHSNPAFNRLTHSSLDVDRMDYLVRDSLATGVPYGLVDLDYLLNNMIVIEEKVDDEKTIFDIALAEKASAAAEHFLVARYYMHKVVYFHKTTFAFEALLRQILYLMRNEGWIYRDGDAIEEMVISEDDPQFFQFHDGYIDAALQKAALDSSDGVLKELCNQLLTRTPPKLLHEVSSLRIGEGQHRTEYEMFRYDREARIRKLSNQFNIPCEFWIWEQLPKDVSFESMGPSVSLARAAELKPEETSGLIRVKSGDGSVRRLLEDKTSIIYHLSQLSLQTSRLYLAKTVDESLLKSIKEEVMGWGNNA